MILSTIRFGKTEVKASAIRSAIFWPGTRSNYLNRRFSRDSWPIVLQPINFIPRSISARIKPSARSTPA
jgi:hypothetical protein